MAKGKHPNVESKNKTDQKNNDRIQQIRKTVMDNEKALQEKILSLEESVKNLKMTRKRKFPFISFVVILTLLGSGGYFLLEKRMASAMLDQILQTEYLVNKANLRREVEKKTDQFKKDSIERINKKLKIMKEGFRKESDKSRNNAVSRLKRERNDLLKLTNDELYKETRKRIKEIGRKTAKLRKEFQVQIDRRKQETIKAVEAEYKKKVEDLRKKFNKKLDEFKFLYPVP